ncbi:unnamed protein product [Albugo candida]|uniref:non-specific serine/threonine protein kinase n=1 Tax=Albugo candida TaxID=65357 RepID=A0A024GTS8_9STRA|nr:unnamed protein product [Albugo candida]|eukprot:CCI49951.1 unnamed protein product [Albugo candida]
MEPKPVIPIDSYENKKLRSLSEVTSSFSVETPPSPRDFLFGSELGQGSYAKVYHAKLKNKSALDFAVKVMDQNFIRRENKTAFVLTERKVMTRLRHPFIVRFYCSFRDSQSLYLVMELCLGGNLLSFIREKLRENEDKGIQDSACCLESTRFYMAELVIAIEYLHSKKVVHRDLKPDNLLFSDKGHLKVIDFGSAKVCTMWRFKLVIMKITIALKDEEDRSTTSGSFCGTVSYVSPEVLKDKPATVATDLWAAGCIMYEMLTGRPAFIAETAYGTFQKVNSYKIYAHDANQLTGCRFVITEEQKMTCFSQSRFHQRRETSLKNFYNRNPTLALVQAKTHRLALQRSRYMYHKIALYVLTRQCAGVKTHMFFDGIEWRSLPSQKPPRTSIATITLPEPHLDGANEHWAVADYFSDCGISESTCSEFGGNARSKSSYSWHMPCKALGVLPPGEQVVKRSLVKIHKRLFKRSRQMVLTDRPRLILFSTGSGELKEDFLLTASLHVKTLSRDTFEIRCSAQAIRSIRVTDISGSAEEWAQAILDIVQHRPVDPQKNSENGCKCVQSSDNAESYTEKTVLKNCSTIVSLPNMTHQLTLFNAAARPAVDDVMEGYNATRCKAAKKTDSNKTASSQGQLRKSSTALVSSIPGSVGSGLSPPKQ